MAASTVLSASHLSIAGVPAELRALLLGKTISGAIDDMEAIAAAALAKGIASGGLVSYSLDGQSGTVNFSALNEAIRALKRIAHSTGGPIMLPIEFGA